MSKKKCLLFLWLITFRTNHCTLWQENVTLSEVALFIAREHLSNLTSTVVIAKNSITAESANENTHLLEYILQHLDGKISVQLFLRDYVGPPMEYYIFIVDSSKAFKQLLLNFDDNSYERQFRFLIVLTKNTSNFKVLLEEIFKLCFHFHVIDVNIVTENPKNGVCMFTYLMYSENICLRSIPDLLCCFNKDLKIPQQIFPEKLRNFHECPIRVAGRIFPPFLNFIGNRSDPKPVGAWDNLFGIEGTLLKYLAKMLNFTIDLQPFSDERIFIRENKTYGIFSQLKDHKVDIAVGAFVDSNSVRWIFSPTTSYHNSFFMYVVRGKRFISSLSCLFKPFSDEVWHLVGAFFLLNVIFILVLKKIQLQVQQFILGEEAHNAVTNFFAVFLGYPIRVTPRRNFARYVFLQLLLLTLILRNAYQGSLYDAFRMDLFVRTPLGQDDLMKWNYKILLAPEMIPTFSILLPEHSVISVYTDGFEKRLEMLENLVGRYASIIIQDCYIYYMEKNLRNGTELMLLPEIIGNYQFVLMLSKHSIFLPVFNRKIKMLMCSGIMARLSSYYASKEKFLKAYIVQQSKKIALSNKRLYALYAICAVMLGISLVVFCLEILSVHFGKLRRILMSV